MTDRVNVHGSFLTFGFSLPNMHIFAIIWFFTNKSKWVDNKSGSVDTMVNRPAESLHGAQANEETWVSTAKVAPEISEKRLTPQRRAWLLLAG